jgi:hypothetical protein
MPTVERGVSDALLDQRLAPSARFISGRIARHNQRRPFPAESISPMLKEIAIVTIVVTNLGQVVSAWQEFFGYEVADRGVVSAELAELWNAGEMQAHEYAILQPANAAPVYIRFVEDEAAAGYRPMTSWGWNATELLLRDTDAVAASLADSGLDIVGAPKDLWPAPDAPRAMQVLGAGNELLYLTTNTQAASALNLDDTMPLVERAFIMVVGGPSMEALQGFYGEQLKLRVDPPSDFKISMISKANNLPLDTTYLLSIAHAAPGYLIELDEMPASVGPRATTEGHLPPGIAIVGFNSDGIEAMVDWVSGPVVMQEFPYNGRKVALISGAIGELVEVILPPDD